jgi:hypothetical protein
MLHFKCFKALALVAGVRSLVAFNGFSGMKHNTLPLDTFPHCCRFRSIQVADLHPCTAILKPSDTGWKLQLILILKIGISIHRRITCNTGGWTTRPARKITASKQLPEYL